MDEERQVIVLSETVMIGDKILASLQITLMLEDDSSSPERTIRIIDIDAEKEAWLSTWDNQDSVRF